ncbi:O-antigen ligase family protein [Anaerostipes sp.]|uniref:O-antigen ligase family protein n=1 Tax=Anaerostipes sp. TaxID=1872530 RepID=UPI00258651DD|nr:O-antigen ligase family protein [Anaerostipes sp.]
MKKISIKKPTVYFLCFLLIPFFKPVGLTYYESINRIFQIWKLMSMFIMILIMCIPIVCNRKFDMIVIKKNGFWGLYLFWIIYILNNLINRIDIGDIVNNAVTSVFLLGIIRYAVKNNWENDLLKSLQFIFKIYIVIQLISVFIINQGVILFEPIKDDYTYFLGTDNYSAFAVYPMLGVILFYEYLNQNTKKINQGFLLTILVTISYLYIKSMTAFSCGAFLIFLLIAYINKKSVTNYINFYTSIILLILLFVSIQYGHVQMVFSHFLENILHKGITLNSRTYIWEASVGLIKNKILTGYGSFSNEQITNYILYGTSHAHNIFLELLLRTGIIGSVGYLWFIIGCAKNNKQYLNKKPINLLTATLIAYIVLGFMDYYVTFQYFYCFMGIFYYAYCFIEKES